VARDAMRPAPAHARGEPACVWSCAARADAGTGKYLERREVKLHKLDHVRLVSHDGVRR
jgi:hypothetical protein